MITVWQDEANIDTWQRDPPVSLFRFNSALATPVFDLRPLDKSSNQFSGLNNIYPVPSADTYVYQFELLPLALFRIYETGSIVGNSFFFKPLLYMSNSLRTPVTGLNPDYLPDTDNPQDDYDYAINSEFENWLFIDMSLTTFPPQDQTLYQFHFRHVLDLAPRFVKFQLLFSYVSSTATTLILPYAQSLVRANNQHSETGLSNVPLQSC